MRICELIQIDRNELCAVVNILPSTLAVRAKAGQFNREESETIIRLIQTIKAALNLFDGDIDEASKWLKQPTRISGNKKPVEAAKTDEVNSELLDLIGRLEHGVFS